MMLVKTMRSTILAHSIAERQKCKFRELVRQYARIGWYPDLRIKKGGNSLDLESRRVRSKKETEKYIERQAQRICDMDDKQRSLFALEFQKNPHDLNEVETIQKELLQAFYKFREAPKAGEVLVEVRNKKEQLTNYHILRLASAARGDPTVDIQLRINEMKAARQETFAKLAPMRVTAAKKLLEALRISGLSQGFNRDDGTLQVNTISKAQLEAQAKQLDELLSDCDTLCQKMFTGKQSQQRTKLDILGRLRRSLKNFGILLTGKQTWKRKRGQRESMMKYQLNALRLERLTKLVK